MMRKVVLLFASALLALALSSGLALAEIMIGTDGEDTLTGTNSDDQIDGKGGNDFLEGKAGNDTYHFAEGSGFDRVVEPAFVQEGTKGKKLAGGTDTLNFSHVSNYRLMAILIPELGTNGVQTTDPFGSTGVDLGPSGRVENVVGGGLSDELGGGSDNNTVSGGPGGSDYLGDRGGDGVLAASNDTYKGFTSPGSDTVEDYGGTADKLDLRPLESTDVTYDVRNYDANDATGTNGNESLLITISDQTEVRVLGYFAPIVNPEGVAVGTPSGRIEQIVFSNETVTSGEVTSPRKKK